MDPIMLTDGVVVLQAPGAADVDRITHVCQDPDVQEWTTIPSPYARDHAESFVRDWVEAGWAEGREATWAIREAGVVQGMVGLTLRGSVAELGYWLGPEARGRGLLSRALGLVLAWAFDDPAGPGLEQVEWHAFAGNWPSWRAVWRHGFRFEGAVRLGAENSRGRRDDWVATLLRGDPRLPHAPWPATTVAAPVPPDGPVRAVRPA